jgi:hypothetical protein
MTHLFKNALSVVLTIVLASSGCLTPEGQSWAPAAGLQVKVADSTELSALGYTFSTEYRSAELMVGGLRTSAGQDRRIKHEFAGFMLNLQDQPREFSGGGHYYFDEGNDLIPYVSFFSTISDSGSAYASDQLGLRFGGGLEFLVAENVAINLGADYLLPILPFEDAFGNQAEFSGLAIRLGLSAGF